MTVTAWVVERRPQVHAGNWRSARGQIRQTETDKQTGKQAQLQLSFFSVDGSTP